MASPDQTKRPDDGEPKRSTPSISLPKGGGALRGIGEKFTANPVNGTGSMAVPIATSPGRSGLGPRLSLSYDSGAGNGRFGFGWNLQLGSITRKTDKGLPQYLDAQDSDVFLLSGAEDLVPVYRQDAGGAWVRDARGDLVLHEDDIGGYRVRRYRPRIEGLFVRIERWTRLADRRDVHWRSISKDNILTLYGSGPESRIADPEDAGRTFSWLICETRDDKGNAVLYRYKAEDGLGVDLSKANERNRGSRDDVRRTANRYLKRIHYGNRSPMLDGNGRRPRFLDKTLVDGQIAAADWMFEAVFDYGEHDLDAPTPNDAGDWGYRSDPFSTYRSGFEVRTTRLCRRVLMFHHFPAEADVGRDCLVRSTDFTYSDQPDPDRRVYTFLRAVTQTGYRRNNGGYDKRSVPPVEFDYTQPVVQDAVEEVDAASLENLPVGIDGAAYRWTDLHGEGIAGILTEQAGAWYYKRNVSPIGQGTVELGPLELVAARPNLALGRSQAELMDLAGRGHPDLVLMGGSTSGFYQHDDEEGWQSFRPFTSRLNRDMRDPNLKFVDLDGDGLADVLITEDDALVWHASLGEQGFAPTRRVAQALDEEHGPRVVFADGTQCIYLADLSGDGLTDLVRIRNGEVCYWPNLGYGRFGMKISMDGAPQFDNPDQFDHRRIRLADIDGSGATDIIYLHRGGVRLYFNESGNSWRAPQTLRVFPPVDDVVAMVPADLLGNGTACLVWSSPLPGDARRQIRYVNLMGSQKPHLLVRASNNLGAETRVQYAPSTKFYLQDKFDGKPWITRLPFPVHVVERVETYDHIGRNRFTTRYAYHHGYFDAVEREFRGFGMVEQWDTEQLAALVESEAAPAANVTADSHVPPVCTKTWFHTGVYLGREHIADFYAGLLNPADNGEYFREPGLTDAEARALLLPDTVLPPGLTLNEERDACRALKGAMLRQEVYAHDGSVTEAFPYTVTEQSFTIQRLQPQETSRHGVFFTHARESISFHYERNPADPRIQHALTLEVDVYGNVLKEAAIGYGRRPTVRVIDPAGQVQQIPNPDLNRLSAGDQSKQTSLLTTYTERRVTTGVEEAETYLTPLSSEARTFELTGYAPSGPAGRYQHADFVEPDPNLPGRLRHIFLGEPAYEATAAGSKQRRQIELTRTLYRKNNLTGLCALGELESLALPGESYTLAFTPGLLSDVYQRPHAGLPIEPLIPNPVAVLGGQADNRGGYVQSQALKADGRFPNSTPDDHWWIPSGRSFFSADPSDSAASELDAARQHFFLPRRYRDPFGHDGTVRFDANDLLMIETRDALDNRVTVDACDYRVLQPRLVSDPNHNQTAVAFDVLGLVAATVVMGKPLPAPPQGDSLTGFAADLTQAAIDGFYQAADPHTIAPVLLQDASTRIIYDLDCFRRTRQANPQDPTRWAPPYAAMLARETHASDPAPVQGRKIQISFSYSDGFGREIQKKMQAEPGPVVPGGTVINPRWVGSGWVIYNNKGKPVRQYQPFFSATHRHEFGVRVGVSPVLFYDPIERVVASLHPDDGYEKVVFDPWRHTTYDVNDTAAPRNAQTGDPRTDPDIRGYVEACLEALDADPAHPWETWYQQRQAGGPHEQAAAAKAAAHADTPTTVHLDALGRPFLTVVRNRVVCANHPLDGTEGELSSRVELDIEGNQLAVRDEDTKGRNAAGTEVGDPRGRIVMRYAYDMLGNRLHQVSMEAGARWILNDVTGQIIRAWDNRGHNFVSAYDVLRRPVTQSVRGTTADSDPRTLNRDILFDKIEYGEAAANAETLNLRTRIYRHSDSAGVVTNAVLNPISNQTESYDFKGNLLRSARQFVSGYRDVPNWRLNPALDGETFTSSNRYDALNRPTQAVAPHSSLARATRTIIQPSFNEAGLLDRVDVWLNRATEPAAPLIAAIDAPSAVGVANIDYDARGRRRRIDYKNGASTVYDYDPLTLRLVRLQTTRDAGAFPEDCPQPPVTGWPGCDLQDLRYVYDPAGNITHIQDAAQQAIYFKNQRVEPSNDYTYDALYRLLEGTGREHLGQGQTPIPHSHDDAGRVNVLSVDTAGRFGPNDDVAFGTYIERYVYDGVGNVLEMRHQGGSVAPGWSRSFTYAEASAIEDGRPGALLKASNRLTSTAVNGSTPLVEAYQHDAHGSIVRMPHLGGVAPGPNMHWDYKDHLRQTDLGGGGTAYYVYDASGRRVRKVWEKPGLTEERIYAGGFEIFRRHGGAIGVNTATLERETLHVMDDQQRIAMVETRTLDTAGNDPAPAQSIRYQFGNHLGSVILELDHQAQIVSYEEYTPFGSSAYQAVRSRTETAKRYRYTGKERDDETGLYYHGARYFAPWLARWTAADPLGPADGHNCYVYSGNRPIGSSDPTGMWEMPSLRTVALVAAIVVVGVVVTVATAGVGTVALGAAIGAVGLTGGAATAATVVGTVAIGAAAGAAGSWSATATAQVATGTYNTPEGEKQRSAAWKSGAIAGALTAGIGAALGVAARSGVTGVKAFQTAAQTSRTVRAVRGAGIGFAGGTTYEASRQEFSGEREQQGGFDVEKIAVSGALSAGMAGATDAAVGPALGQISNSLLGAGYRQGLRLGSLETRSAVLGALSRTTGQRFVIGVHGTVPEVVDGETILRPVASIATPEGPQAWYIRTGASQANTQGATAGEWAPFEGFITQEGTLALAPNRTGAGVFPGDFNKFRFTDSFERTPLYRFGTVGNLQTSKILGSWRIPVNEQVVPWEGINPQLQAAGVPIQPNPRMFP